MPSSLDIRTGSPDPAPVRGLVFDVQRWSLHDGPGIRTVFFLKGCPLRCAWCCNPESQNQAPEVGVFPDRCSGCGVCIPVCTRALARPAREGGVADRDACTGCGECVNACPNQARSVFGALMSPENVRDAALRDAPFQRRSGGGVTFSGGEPFQQPDFLAKCASLCASAGIAVAVETCGVFAWNDAVAALSDIDLVILDIKHMDPGIHRRLTGKPNDVILENARRFSRAGIPLLVRTPLIPGCTDDPANVEAIRAFVGSELPTAVGHETLPYHELGKGKYSALGRKYPIAE